MGIFDLLFAIKYWNIHFVVSIRCMFILQKMQQLLGKETRISSKISPHVFLWNTTIFEKVSLTWNKCLPIWIDDVTSSDVIATHAYFRRFVVANHDDFILQIPAFWETFSRTYYISNFLTWRFWVFISSHTVKTFDSGRLNALKQKQIKIIFYKVFFGRFKWRQKIIWYSKVNKQCDCWLFLLYIYQFWKKNTTVSKWSV